MELSTQDRCMYIYIYTHFLQVEGRGYGHLRWHTPLSRPFNLGRLCKNQGKTSRNMQNCRKHTGGPKETMENGAAQAKSQGQNIDGAFHTRQVCIYIYIYIYTHTSCKWKGGVWPPKMAHASLKTIQPGKTMQKSRQNQQKHAKL